MGYANTKIRIDFPDLSEDDDPIYVVIRNPKTVPLDKLEPATSGLGADGQPDIKAAADATYGIMAGLVVDWHVYDANVDDGGTLPVPATAAAIRSLPLEIIQELMKRITEVVSPPQ